MALFTVVTVVRRGDFNVLAILDGPYGTIGAPDSMEEYEIFTNVIEADSREDAERAVKAKYFPSDGTDEEVPC